MSEIGEAGAETEEAKAGSSQEAGAVGPSEQSPIADGKNCISRRRLSGVGTRAVGVFGTQDLEAEAAACQACSSTGDEVRGADEEAVRHSRADVNFARHGRGALINSADRSRKGWSRRDRAGRGKSETRWRRSENTEGHRAGIVVRVAPEVYIPGRTGNDGAWEGERRTMDG